MRWVTDELKYKYLLCIQIYHFFIKSFLLLLPTHFRGQKPCLCCFGCSVVSRSFMQSSQVFLEGINSFDRLCVSGNFVGILPFSCLFILVLVENFDWINFWITLARSSRVCISCSQELQSLLECFSEVLISMMVSSNMLLIQAVCSVDILSYRWLWQLK